MSQKDQAMKIAEQVARLGADRKTEAAKASQTQTEPIDPLIKKKETLIKSILNTKLPDKERLEAFEELTQDCAKVNFTAKEVYDILNSLKDLNVPKPLHFQ